MLLNKHPRKIESNNPKKDACVHELHEHKVTSSYVTALVRCNVPITRANRYARIVLRGARACCKLAVLTADGLVRASKTRKYEANILREVLARYLPLVRVYIWLYL